MSAVSGSLPITLPPRNSAFRVRRAVLRIYIALTLLVGVTAGLAAGLRYAGVDLGSHGETSTDRIINAVGIGAGVLFGACVVAALVSLAIEIADSLWRLVRLRELEDEAA